VTGCRGCRRGAVALAAIAASVALAPVALAGPPPPIELKVLDGEDAWHPSPAFHLYWTNPPGVAAVHYRVRDPFGSAVVGEQRVYWKAESIEVRVPAIPGAYLAEVWLEDGGGGQGAAAEARLRFDDARPPAAQPHVAGAWIGRAAFPLAVRLEHPASEPLSGVRGYAVSVDLAPGREPCVALDRCSDAETDLQGGAENDAFTVPELPEGTSYVSAVAVSGSGMRSASTGRATLRVDKTDPVTRLVGAPTGWVDRPVRLTATASDAGSALAPGSGMAPDGHNPAPFTAIRIDGGAPAVAVGDTVSAEVIGQGTHTIAYYARDLAGNVDDGGGSNGVPNRPPATALVRIDLTAPSVAFRGAQDPLDPELIRAKVADPLSGPDLERGWIGVRRAGSGDPYRPLTTWSSTGELRARWDSDSYPPGEYEFEATGYDLAGNATTSGRRLDGEKMTLTDPVKTPTTLLAKLDGGMATRRAVSYGRGALLSGRLASGNGRPLGGAPVRIVERFDQVTLGSRESTVRTAADGRFAAQLPPGPSRETVVLFDGSRVLTRARSRPLRLDVRAGVLLQASAATARVDGPPLVFRGRVAATAGTLPPAGKAVELQFRLRGSPWSEFRTIQTDRRGRFRYAYRFSDDDSRGVRFQFRAYAPAQDGWPYEPAGSPPIVVRGR
jgi:hypothetical protein